MASRNDYSSLGASVALKQNRHEQAEGLALETEGVITAEASRTISGTHQWRRVAMIGGSSNYRISSVSDGRTLRCDRDLGRRLALWSGFAWEPDEKGNSIDSR